MGTLRALFLLLLTAAEVCAQTQSLSLDKNGNVITPSGAKFPTGIPLRVTDAPASATDVVNKTYADSLVSGGGTVSSVFGRTGAVVSATNDYTFSQIGLKPSTLTGYGITDAQPLDGDLTALAALTGTNNIYYRSSSNVWSPVTIGANMTFSGGTLDATGGGGTGDVVGPSGGVVTNQIAVFNGSTGKIIKGALGTGIATITGGVLGAITDNSTLWDTAYADRLKWDGGTGAWFNSTTAKASLGLVIGTNVQAWDTDLDVWATKTPYAGAVVVTTGKTFTDTNNLTLSGTDGSTLNIGGGGTLGTAAYTASSAYEVPLTFSQSVSRSTNTVTLSGDSASPGNTMLYGTNGSGTKGWYAQPSGGGNVSNSGTPAVNQVATWTDATHATGGSTLVYNNPGATGVLTIGGTDVGLSRNAASVLEVDTGTPGLWGALKVGTSDGLNTSVTDGVTMTHRTSPPAGSLFGTGILFNATDTSTHDVNIGEVQAFWQGTPTHGSATSDFAFRLNNAAGSLSVAAFIHGGGVVDATTGFKINNSAATSGKILQGNGTNYVASTPTWPTAAGSAGKVVISDGTNLGMSTPTYPTAAGTAGYTVRSDGTNFASYPQDMFNSSTGVQVLSTTDAYIAGSSIVVAAGDFKAKGQYRCLIEVTKSAGTGNIVITLRIGTAGTTSDAAIQTYTFGAGTGVADTGTFEVIATFRSVGSGTSAVVNGICRAQHNLENTGLYANVVPSVVFLGSPLPSAGFNSSTATTIGISFNGSTAFNANCNTVQAQLAQ